jgi:hypothetical protein
MCIAVSDRKIAMSMISLPQIGRRIDIALIKLPSRRRKAIAEPVREVGVALGKALEAGPSRNARALHLTIEPHLPKKLNSALFPDRFLEI